MPGEHNPIANDTAGIPYGRDAIYVLGRGGDVDQAGAATGANVGLCSIRVGQSPDCITVYTASGHGGTLTAVCEDKNDELMHNKVH